MARAPVSKTGGWGFESLHSCHARRRNKPRTAVAAAGSMAVGCFVGRVEAQYLQLYVRGGEDAAADDKRGRTGREHPESSIHNHLVNSLADFDYSTTFRPESFCD
jgi:hypothetical protein